MENKYTKYLEKCEYYISLQKQYTDKFDELGAEVEKKAFRREFASGGEALHRGWYCPSPILDIVVGGCNRGKLLKKSPNMKRNRYEYIFDNTDKLICVNKFTYWDDIKENLLYNREFIINSSNYSFSIGFNTNLDIPPVINMISECMYDKNGRIIEYYFALCDIYYGGKGCSEIRVELFEYENGLLTSSVMQDCFFGINILRKNKYFFYYDNEGLLDSYSIKEYIGDVEESWDGRIYKVSKKVTSTNPY